MKRALALFLALFCMVNLFACPAPTPDVGGSTSTTTNASGAGDDLPTAPLTLTTETPYLLVGEPLLLSVGGTEGKNVWFNLPHDGITDTTETGTVLSGVAATAGTHTFTVTDGTRSASCTVTVFGAEEAAYPAADPLVRILGRTEKNADGAILLNNTASGFEVTFYGKSLSVDLCNVEGKIDTALFALFVDGVGDAAVDQIDPRTAGVASGDTRRITLASFDTAGLHTVRMQKLTQESIAGAIFSAVYVEGGLLPTEADEPLRLMVYGDSITCGHSNMRGPEEDDYWSSAKENGLLTYAMRVATSLNADAHVFSKSGLGLYTDTSGGTLPVLKDIYGKVSPASQTDWDMTSWVPDAIIIGIGTNDICAPADASVPYTEDEFVEEYVAFVKELASIWGEDKCFFLCSSMMLTAVAPIVKKVSDRCLAEGLFVYFVDLPLRSNAHVIGHPDDASHITGAGVLYDAVVGHMGLN